MAPHSSVLAWRIPGMGEPGGLPSMGSHRVGHDRSDLAAAAMTTDVKTSFNYKGYIKRIKLKRERYGFNPWVGRSPEVGNGNPL